METLKYIIEKIKLSNPVHGRKLDRMVANCNEQYFQTSEEILKRYDRFLKNRSKDINYSIDCYLKMCGDIMYEQLRFMETGKYSSQSFKEVNERVYADPSIMEYYLHGLMLSQFLWKHHYIIFEGFADKLKKYTQNISKYLEIGAGHGLFTSEALRQISEKVIFDVVDISDTAIEMTKELLGKTRINYYLTDIFVYDPKEKYDFICMGEVLEHVEEPKKLLERLKYLLTPDGHAFITTPTNAPTIDHIYLFKNTNEVRDMIGDSGFEIVEEMITNAEEVSNEKAEEKKITQIFAAFIKPSKK